MSGLSSSVFSFGGSGWGDCGWGNCSSAGCSGLRDRGRGVGYRRDRPEGLSYCYHYGGGEIGKQMGVALVEAEDRAEILDGTAEGRRRHRARKFQVRGQNQIGVG